MLKDEPDVLLQHAYMKDYSHQTIIFFDGVCNLCNRSVQFIIKRNKNKNFLFTSLQSDVAQEILLQFHVKNVKLESIILLDEGKIYTKSSAALRIAGYLDGGWKILSLLRIFPIGLRNLVYDFIAKKRYAWFGKRATCMVPTDEIKELFL